MSRRDDLNRAFSEMDKRTKIMLGVLGLIVILGAGYFFLLKPSSSSTPSASLPVPAGAGVTPKATPTPKASITPVVGLPEQANPGRDPFAPLPQESAAAATQAAAVAASPAPVVATPIPSATPSPSAAATSHTVKLISISGGTTASITLDGTDKTVKAGNSITTGVACVKVTADSIIITINNKPEALAPGQSVSF